MTNAPNDRWSIRHNFDLILVELARWPTATTLVVLFYAVAAAIGYAQDYNLSPQEMTFAVAGTAMGVVGLKILLMLMLYPILQKSRFPGSYIVACFIAFVPIFAFYASAAFLLLRDKHEDPPTLVLIPFALFSYAFFSLVFGATLYANQALHLMRGRKQDPR